MVINNCGAVGRTGPSQTQCVNAYKNLPQYTKVESVPELGCGAPHIEGSPSRACRYNLILIFFLLTASTVRPQCIQFITESTFVDSGIQTVTIPTTGAWRITAYGARGGYGQPAFGKVITSC